MDLQYDHPSMLGTLVAVDGTYGEDVEYSTATVNVANGSVAINLTGGAWIPTTPAMRSIVIAGAQKEYRITIMSPTTGVLDTPYQGSTDAAAPYKLLGETIRVIRCSRTSTSPEHRPRSATRKIYSA